MCAAWAGEQGVLHTSEQGIGITQRDKVGLIDDFNLISFLNVTFVRQHFITVNTISKLQPLASPMASLRLNLGEV